MIATSAWSLLVPSIEMAGEQGRIAWLPAAVGFSFGYAFLLLLDAMIPHHLLSFAAGAMLYVVIEELIPESQMGEYSNIGTIGSAHGFLTMMIVDVAFD